MIDEGNGGKPRSYSSGQVARLLGIPARTVRRYLSSGWITGRQNPITGRWTVSEDSVTAFLEAHGLLRRTESSE